MAPIQKKICLLGEYSVGKTSLIRRFVEGRFEDKYLSTIGTKISRKNIVLNDDLPLTMLIWDLAGGEKFSRMMQSYYRGAAGAIVVCDLTRESTLFALEHYVTSFWSINPKTPLIFVGNKIDLKAQQVVSQDALAAMSSQCGVSDYFFSSAKTGENVELIFYRLGQRLAVAA